MRDIRLVEEELLGKNGLCDECEEREGAYCVDPFREDVWNKVIVRGLCDECYQILRDDI